MNAKCNSFLGLSICFLFFTLCYIGYCFGELKNNAKCFTTTGGQSTTCANTGNIICQDKSTLPGMGCYYCDSNNYIPSKFCGGSEYSLCDANAAGFSCGYVIKRKGECIKIGNQYSCKNTDIDGHCFNNQYIYSCQ
jgi:hypothetical protein